MSGPCYYHPQSSAVAQCVQCGMPVCEECKDTVNDKSVCKKCVGAIRTRLEREMGSAPAASYAATPAMSSATAAPPSYTGTMDYGGSVSPSAPAEKPEAKNVLLGVLWGAIIGLVGAILVEKVLFYTGFGLSLLYVFIGYGVGFGVHRATGRGGPGMAFLAVGVMALCLLAGQAVYANDMLAKAALDDGFPKPPLSGHIMLIVTEHMNFMHWVLIAIGLGACYRAVEQQEG